jgi:hypothetical protein
MGAFNMSIDAPSRRAISSLFGMSWISLTVVLLFLVPLVIGGMLVAISVSAFLLVPVILILSVAALVAICDVLAYSPHWSRAMWRSIRSSWVQWRVRRYTCSSPAKRQARMQKALRRIGK